MSNLKKNLNVAAVEKLTAQLKKGEESVLAIHLKIGEVIREGTNWADTKEGKDALKSEGLKKADLFPLYGFSKSWAYKLIQAAS